MKLLFHKQNSLLKILFIISLMTFSLKINLQEHLILIIPGLYFLFDCKIYEIYLKVFVRLAVFFSALIIGGIIFEVDFLKQIILIIRIMFFALLLVYLRTTTNLEGFLYDLKKAGLDNNSFIIFIASLSKYLDEFMKIFSTMKFNKQSIKQIINSISAMESKLAKDSFSSQTNIQSSFARSFWANLTLLITFLLTLIGIRLI